MFLNSGMLAQCTERPMYSSVQVWEYINSQLKFDLEVSRYSTLAYLRSPLPIAGARHSRTGMEVASINNAFTEALFGFFTADLFGVSSKRLLLRYHVSL
jgi:hypothetical protein